MVWPKDQQSLWDCHSKSSHRDQHDDTITRFQIVWPQNSVAQFAVVGVHLDQVPQLIQIRHVREKDRDNSHCLEGVMRHAAQISPESLPLPLRTVPVESYLV